MPQHSPLLILCYLLSFIAYLTMLTFHGMAASGDKDFFQNKTRNVSDRYHLETTPASWTTNVWGIIYTWNMLWLIYVATTFFRCNRIDLENYFYVRPGILNPLFYLLFMLNNAFHVGWFFLWDRHLFIPSTVVLALATFTLYGCLFLAYKSLRVNLGTLVQRYSEDVWSIRILIHNGISFYAAWITFDTLLNLGMAITNFKNDDPNLVPDDVASSITLSALLVVVFLYFVVDNFIFDSYLRYTLTPYLAIILALCGVVTNRWGAKTNFVYSAVLLALTSACFLIKFSFMVWRHRNKPLGGNNNANTWLGLA